MKVINYIILSFALSLNSSFAAEEVKVFSELRNDLSSMLSEKQSLNLNSLKDEAQKRNTDVEIAFQNYLIAKKRVAIARASFNPLTTGTALGVALGWNFLWAPMAVDAVLSIPTKIYNVKENKFLETAALYNTYEAREVLNNEISHLYYDLVSHQLILNTIDEEISVRQYQLDQYQTNPNATSASQFVNATILRLKMQKIDVYNLFVEELAALKTLIALDPSAEIKLSQNPLLLDKNFVLDVNEQNMSDLALVRSSLYKKKINLQHAAEMNIKSVKWSLITLSGFNFSYKTRVENAENDEELAELEKVSSAMTIKNQALVNFEKLKSNINISNYYNQVSENSLDYFTDIYQMFLLDKISSEAVVNTAVAAIQDFRSKAISHYNSWSALDDLSTALNLKLEYKSNEVKLQDQLENSSFYGLSEADFKVTVNQSSNDSLMLTTKTDKHRMVKKVTYLFDDNAFHKTTSKAASKDFRSYLKLDEFSPEHSAGTAIIELHNGHELEVRFKF